MEHTYRDDKLKKDCIARLNKIAGQVDGLKKMINNDRYCKDVLTQVKACEKSLKSFSLLVLNKHLHSCVVNKIKQGDETVISEIIELLRQDL